MQNDKVILHYELDPIMETAGLMFLMVNKENYKEVWINDLNEFGINGQLFYEKHSGFMELYIAEFVKHYQAVEDINQFVTINNSELDDYYRLLYSSLVLERSWVEDFEKVTEEAVLERVIKFLSNRSSLEEDEVTLFGLRTTDKFIKFLDSCDFDEREKWLLLQLYCQPKVVFGKYIKLINANIPAYEKAIAVVQEHCNKLIAVYKDSVENQKLSAYKHLIQGINNDEVVVMPCLAYPNLLALIKDRLYYGLLLDVIPLRDHSPEETKEFLQMRLKALSDASKLNIIQFLKDGEKYNLEIAEHLGITAATASHHMNVLLATGIVGINKQQGKVYYHIERDEIENFIRKLELYLL